MPSIDVADEIFIVADPDRLAAHLARPELSLEWWPALTLTAFMDRGVKGTRWSISGELHGSMELWLEPWHDGVILHWYLRAEPYRTQERAERLRVRYALAHKEHVNALKDGLERGRAIGTGRES